MIVRRLFLPVVFLLGLTAMQSQPFIGPNGNGTLDHADDLRWVSFQEAKIAGDEARGEYRAIFSPALARMDGRVFAITGYIVPINTEARAAHFILTRRSEGCPFCPANALTEAIEVFSTAPVEYTQAPVTLEGRLHLIARSETGLFYRIDHARIKQ